MESKIMGSSVVAPLTSSELHFGNGRGGIFMGTKLSINATERKTWRPY